MNSNQYGGGIMAILGLFLLAFTSSGLRLYSLFNLIGIRINYEYQDIVNTALTLGPFLGGVLLILGVLLFAKGLKDSKKQS